MKLQLIRHLWGVDAPWFPKFDAMKADDFSGIEVAHSVIGDAGRFRDELAQRNFTLIPQIFTEGNSVAEHVASFRQQYDFVSTLQPQLINCHSGRDGFSPEQAETYFREVLAIEADGEFAVAHETHRGRLLFNPWQAAGILDAFPEMRLCCDLSHWVCVCERLLQTEEDIIRQVASQTLHLHARVGFEEGPQVPDPRVPAYASHLAAHEGWWDLVWQAQTERGFGVSTLTPEFGPPNYLHVHPETQAPMADLWDICHWMAARQAERFNGRGSS